MKMTGYSDENIYGKGIEAEIMSDLESYDDELGYRDEDDEFRLEDG